MFGKFFVEYISENKDINNPPNYKSIGASGFDIQANEHVTIPQGSIKTVKTGLKIFIKNKNYELQIRSRSGLASKNGIFVLNAPGTVDSDYQGEICIILANFSSSDFHISLGDRIAQGVFSKVEKPLLKHVFKFSNSTSRGEAGFGSTGI
jgi:dUTP pyrophosphatase